MPDQGWNIKPRGAEFQKRSPLTPFNKVMPVAADNSSPSQLLRAHIVLR